MMYPTIEEVNNANHLEICRWYRFLPSPGEFAIGKPDFNEVLEKEAGIMGRIDNRLKEFGGFTTEISKLLGR